MPDKKRYIRPEIVRVDLDRSITLMMKSAPMPPMPRGDGSKGTDTPFSSPFENKPFNWLHKRPVSETGLFSYTNFEYSLTTGQKFSREIPFCFSPALGNATWAASSSCEVCLRACCWSWILNNHAWNTKMWTTIWQWAPPAEESNSSWLVTISASGMWSGSFYNNLIESR